jgi:hypothetical protein
MRTSAFYVVLISSNWSTNYDTLKVEVYENMLLPADMAPSCYYPIASLRLGARRGIKRPLSPFDLALHGRFGSTGSLITVRHGRLSTCRPCGVALGASA